jgi:branched-chain amino acid transport system substrate-binding protein
MERTRRKLLTTAVAGIGVILLIAMLSLVACSSTPTSTAPTTSAPTTSAPTTSAAAPTTAKPTTSAPTSAAPTSAAPTSSSPAAAPAKPYKIGYILSTSGFFSVYEAVEEQYLKIMAQTINDKGGFTVQGQKYTIQLVGEDGKSTVEGHTAAANKLVFDEKVKFAVGPTCIFDAASTAVYEANKVLHVTGYNTQAPGLLDATTPYNFTAYNSVAACALAGIQVIKKEYPNATKMAILTPDDGNGQYILDFDKKYFPLNGFSVKDSDAILFPNETQDFGPMAAKLNATAADVYWMQNALVPHVGSNLKALREMGNTKPVIVSVNMQGEDIIAYAETAATKVMSLGFTLNDPSNPALLQEILKRSKNSTPVNMDNSNGLYALIQVIQKANSLDPDVVRKVWEQQDTLDTPYGTGTLCGDQNYGIRHHAISHPMPYQLVVDQKITDHGWIQTPPIP